MPICIEEKKEEECREPCPFLMHMQYRKLEYKREKRGRGRAEEIVCKWIWKHIVVRGKMQGH